MRYFGQLAFAAGDPRGERRWPGKLLSCEKCVTVANDLGYRNPESGCGASDVRGFWDDLSVSRRGSFPVALILLVLILLGAAAAIIVRGPLADKLGAVQHTPYQVTTATVVQSVPCSTAVPEDVVEVVVHGVPEQARLDGCGHTQGQRIQVEVPRNAPGHNLEVQMYTPGMNSGTGSAPGRLDWVLLTLAVIAGGGYVLLLRWPAVHHLARILHGAHEGAEHGGTPVSTGVQPVGTEPDPASSVIPGGDLSTMD
jgi:hypothetical protein